MIGVTALQPDVSYVHVFSQGPDVMHLRAFSTWDRATSVSWPEKNPCRDVLKDRFMKHAAAWQSDCAYLSSVREMAIHPAYQQIIGMGQDALPFIFAALEREPDHWFWALRAITQEDPVLTEHRGQISRMAQDWLDWARSRGMQW